MTVPVPPQGTPLYWLGGQIDIRVEVDTGSGAEFGGGWDIGLWDSALWGSEGGSWEDMTPYVIQIETNAGAQRWGERFEAGTASIYLSNVDGIFTPTSGVDPPFFREWRLGRRIRVVAIPDPSTGVKVPLWTGRLDASYDTYVDFQYGVTTVLQCVDYMGTWASYDPTPTTATGAQTTHARVGAALDRIDWPVALRDIQTGDHNMQTSTLDNTTLEECELAAEAEGGAFFAGPDGTATFKSKDWLNTDTRSTVIQGYIGYDDVPTGAQSAHYVDAVTSWELARVFNDIQFQRDGGTLQEVEDEASQLAYGAGDGGQVTPRTFQKTDFLNTTDGEVLTLATRFLAAFKDARMRVDQVTIEANADPTNDDLNRLMWDTRFGDRVKVKVSPPHGWEFERECHVFGISHTIDQTDWTVTLRLDDAQSIAFTYWKLEDPILGVLGQTTRVM